MYTETDKSLENLDADQLREFVESESLFFSQSEDFSTDTETAKRIFKLIHALIYLGDYEEAIYKIHQAENIVYSLLGHDTSSLEAIDFAAEWNLLAMRFTAFHPGEFNDYPYFKEIVRLYENHPSGFHIQMVHGYISLIINYQVWKNRGGNAEKLPPDQQQELENLVANYPNQLQEMAQNAKTQGDIEKEVLLNRALARYAIAINDPNLAIGCLKVLRDILPQYPKHLSSDIADVDMEMGMLFVSYKQYSQAKPYFEQALKSYQSLSEEYELFAAQAEGWITECINKS